MKDLTLPLTLDNSASSDHLFWDKLYDQDIRSVSPGQGWMLSLAHQPAMFWALRRSPVGEQLLPFYKKKLFIYSLIAVLILLAYIAHLLSDTANRIAFTAMVVDGTLAILLCGIIFVFMLMRRALGDKNDSIAASTITLSKDSFDIDYHGDGLRLLPSGSYPIDAETKFFAVNTNSGVVIYMSTPNPLLNKKVSLVLRHLPVGQAEEFIKFLEQTYAQDIKRPIVKALQNGEKK
jgi:hypothetical protein